MFLMQQVLKSWALVRTRAQLLCFFIIRAKKKWKKHVNENCENWALVRTRAQLLQFWGARKWASKSTLNAKVTPTFFLRWDKISQKNQKSSKCQNFRSNCHWHAHKITQKVSTISITLECAKSDIFFGRTCTDMHIKQRNILCACQWHGGGAKRDTFFDILGQNRCARWRQDEPRRGTRRSRRQQKSSNKERKERSKERNK